MKQHFKITFISLLVCISFRVYSQKPVIDTACYSHWPTIASPIISNNGKYVMYRINEVPVGHSTIVLESSDGTWKREVMDADNWEFSAKSDYAIIIAKGNLLLLSLGTNKVDSLPASTSRVISNRRDDYILSFNDSLKQIRIRSFNSRTERVVEQVMSFEWSPGRDDIILKKINANNEITLSLFDLATARDREIFKGREVSDFVFANDGSGLAFKAKTSSSTNDIYYYRTGAEKASLIVTASEIKRNTSFDAGDIESIAGKVVYISLAAVSPNERSYSNKRLTIWNTDEEVLQSKRVRQPDTFPVNFKASINVDNKQWFILEKENQRIDVKGTYGILYQYTGHFIPATGIVGWEPIAKVKSQYIVDCSNGEKKALQIKGISEYVLSPHGKYLTWFDSTSHSVWSRDLHNNSEKIIGTIESSSGEPSIRMVRDDWRYPQIIAGWTSDDDMLIMYVQNDLLLFDPSGKKIPVNMTKGDGNRNGIVFGLMNDGVDLHISPSQKLIVPAFDINSKKNGFYAIDISGKKSPERLSMDDCLYYAPAGLYIDNRGVSPVKAKSAKLHLVVRQKEDDAPNYYTTSDFKAFTKISDLQPQKKYNWYSTELYSVKSPDGTQRQMMVYKPENFDSTKRYPVVFYYYHSFSNNLHAYLVPQAFQGSIDVPTLVSNGYVVACPDTDPITWGTSGESALMAVESAAKFLSSMPWVDPKKMAITGHSWGGFETNYIVTHSKLFAAAVSADGYSDIISGYNGIDVSKGTDRQFMFEDGGPYRIGGTLWSNLIAYQKNSAVLSADNVTTPLLLLHGDQDFIPIQQAIEFFLSLRKLHKKAWLLEYTEGNHDVWGPDALDFTQKAMDFLGYYLKGQAPAKWMKLDQQ